MAGRIRIPPYKPLGIFTQAVPGGGYVDIDASAGQFGASPLLQLGLQAAQGAVGIAGAVSPYLGSDNEAAVKAVDTKLGETEQALLFDPQSGYLNLQGQAALQQAPAVLDAYSEAQARTLDTAADDDQRRMLQELADRRLASFNEVVERHGAAQRQSWYDQVADHRIAAMRADSALHWNSDALLRRALGTARAEVRERAERKGWDSPLTEAALRRETSRVLVSAIGSAVDHDPERARVLRTRYAAVIEDTDRAALDALLAEAQTRERAKAASREILNTAPPEGEPSTAQWRLQRAGAVADPAVRSATIRFLNSAASAAEARARTLGEQVLAHVLKDGLTDPSQIPVSEWMALDAVRRRAIATRLDHNAAGIEPAPNPLLVDRLATQMTEAPQDFARRDLIPEIAHLPLPQWQRFREWQAGLRRDDPATWDEVYAIKRGLQLAATMLPADDSATNYRADLIEDIDTQRRTGKSPDDAAIVAMLERRAPDQSAQNNAFPLNPGIRSSRHPNVVQIQDSTTYAPSRQMPQVFERAIQLEMARRFNDAVRSLPGRHLDPEFVAWGLGLVQVTTYPKRINTHGQAVYYDRQTDGYVVRNTQGGTGYWVEFDAQGQVIGTTNEGLIPAVPAAQLPADELEKIWQNPPNVPPVMPPPAFPGRPTDRPQKPMIETFPHGDDLPQIIPGPRPDGLSGPTIETIPIPEIQPPIIYEYEKWQTHPDGKEYTGEEYDEFQREKLPYTDRNTGHPHGHEVLEKYTGTEGSPKTAIPPDAERVYNENSLRLDKKTWIGRNEHGVYYKYQHDNAGKVHFQGYVTRPEIQQRMGRAGKVTLKKLDQ